MAEFTEIFKILSGTAGKVSVRGWLHHKRRTGGIQFLELRDGTGFVQCTLTRKKVDEKTFKEIDLLPVESVLEIEGTVREDPRAPQGREIEIEKITVMHQAAEDFPIAKKFHGPEFLLDKRHLWVRSKQMHHILKIRAKFLELARKWFSDHGYTEVQMPILTQAAVEGGSTLFPVKYFDETAYLTQSWQLYAEAVISTLGKIYTVAPSFRAEKSRTRKHLTEYWHLEVEIPFAGLEELLKVEEDFLTFVIHGLAKEMAGELKELGRDVKDLAKIKIPFPRITYKQAVELLKKSGVKIKYGDDLGADEEKILSSKFDVPFFLTHFPKQIKAFYHKPDPKDPQTTLSTDMEAPEGYGVELTGGGQRIDDYEEMVKRMKEEKLDPKAYEWYLDLRKYGSVPHSGFGLGVERIVMWICKLQHIRDATAFPRLINRVYP